MSNFKLLLKVLKRNKFQKNFIITTTIVFTVVEVYYFICSIIDGYVDSLILLDGTLRMSYFLIILLMFFSYECFSKINPYKESFSIYKKNTASVYKSEFTIFVFYIALLSLEAILINVIYIIANAQFSFALLVHTITVLLCYYFLCLLTAVFIGLLLSYISRKKKYIAYLLMVIFAFSETEMIQISSMHLFEDSGKDFSKILEFFFLAPNSLRRTPNEQTGFVLDINKISQLLFFIVLSVMIFIIINNKSKTKKIWKSIICSIFCLCLLLGYYVPISVPKMDMSASGDMNDDMYYLYYKDIQQEKNADFNVEKYDLEFSTYLNLKAKVKVYVDNKNLEKYNFTLYHNYKISKVTNQNGAPLRFVQDHDYLTISSDNNEIEYLYMEYYGGSVQYYSSYAGVFLPANFSYYPIPGFHKIFDEYYGFLDNSLPYNATFDVKVHSLKQVYCNLEEKKKNQFSGNANSITILSGFYDTYKINDTSVIYPYFSKTYKPNELKEYLGQFIEENENIKKIFIIPYMNLSQYEQIRTYDNYLFTASKFDIEQSSFESKISINKKEFYNFVCDYYNPDTDQEYLNLLEEDASDQQKELISIIKVLFDSKYKEAAAKEINDYLIDSNDNRSPLAFLNALGEKYA